MDRTRVFVMVIFASLMCLQVLAAPCIECKDCKGSNHCLSNCQKVCPKPTPQVVVNGEDCKRYGREAGAKIIKDACDTTLLYCNGGQKKLGARRFPVSLQQCGNIAYGLCQERAMNRFLNPCWFAFNGGHRSCKKEDFMSFYTGEVNDRCNQAVSVFDKKP